MIRKVKIVIPVLALIALVFGFGKITEAKDASQVVGVVNINTASMEELVIIPGIGPAKAQAIIDQRDTEKFATVEDLVKVKGIGEKLLGNIRAYITVDGQTTAKLIKDKAAKLNTPTDGERG